jgi:hypothetical protein
MGRRRWSSSGGGPGGGERPRGCLAAAVLGLAMTCPAACSPGPPPAKAVEEDRSAAHLREAERAMSAFAANGNLLLLLDAAGALDHATGLGRPRRVRREALDLWLALVVLHAKQLDPRYREQDNAILGDPFPPPGIRWEPGLKPSDVADPALRRQWEKMIEDNRRAWDFSQRQGMLRNFGDQIWYLFAAFVHDAYAHDATERAELPDAVRRRVADPALAARILELAR